MNLDDILKNGDAWYSVFCSTLLTLNKDQKKNLSNKFKEIIETTIPNNQFTPEKNEKFLSAYKRAYYMSTGTTYPPPETK